MGRVSVTLFNDPGCPFGYSASPALAALRWRFGDQLDWRLVMIGLTDDPEEYIARGYDTLFFAQSARRFRRFGMPIGAQPKPRVFATAPACRAVVAVRLDQPELEWPAFRALQRMQFTTEGLLDVVDDIRDALDEVEGLDVQSILWRLEDPDVVEVYERDRAEARRAAGTPADAQGKTTDTDGAVRFTAPSLIFETGGRSLTAGGFQPVEAYDVLLANLDPALERRPAPEDPVEALLAFPEGLATAEVAAVMGVEVDEAEDALLAAADGRRAARLPAGNDAVWIPERRARLRLVA